MDNHKVILDNLYDGVYFVDQNRRITYWNKAAEEITGFSAQEVVGRPCSDNILKHINQDGIELCKTGCPLTASLLDGRNHEAEVSLHHKDGHRLPVSIRITPIRDAKGKIIGAAELFSDNSAKAAIMERMRELEELALLDPLTRLANRRFLEITLEKRLQEMERYQWSTGILFMDIDNFKKFNDTYGHDVGDRALKLVADTLMSNSRVFDVFGRWGGEEFVGILRNITCPRLYEVAEKLRLLIKNAPLPTETGAGAVTVSVGGTMLQPGDTLKSVLKRADSLMYKSKSTGKNKACVDCAP